MHLFQLKSCTENHLHCGNQGQNQKNEEELNVFQMEVTSSWYTPGGNFFCETFTANNTINQK